jgi:PPP family 3-phenylpropionic acid transporter
MPDTYRDSTVWAGLVSLAQWMNVGKGKHANRRVDDANSLSVRLSLIFGALFLITGVQLPYLPVWLDWRGLTATEIGIVTSAPLFLGLAVTPTIAFVADRIGDYRWAIVVLAWCAFAAVVALAQMHGFWSILVLVTAFLLSVQTMMPLTAALAMSGVKTLGLDYGRMRLWGSLTFIGAGFAGAAVLDSFGAKAILWLLAVGTAITVGAAQLLACPRSHSAGHRTATSAPIGLAEVADLAGSADFLLFLCAAGAVQATHAVFYAFGVLHWRTLGISNGAIGLLWAIGVVAEVGLFAFSRSIVHRVGAVELIVAGAAAAVVRWLSMAFDPPFFTLVLLQCLHALTFGATHLGAMHFIGHAAGPERAGTAQALHATATTGVAMGGAVILSGLLYGRLGGQSYLAMAVIALLGLLASTALWRRRRYGAGRYR